MTLIQLRYLVAIVDAGLNVTAAARRVHATQPGLSKQIRQMEGELGLSLFARCGRNLGGLTREGEVVVERARAVISEVAGIQAMASDRRYGSAELRVATTHTQARFVLPPAVARLKERFPDLRLHLMPVGEKEALQLLDQGAADIALVSAAEAPATRHTLLPLYRWSLMGLWPPGRPKPAGPITLETLAALPLVTYESAVAPGSSVARTFEEGGLDPIVACTARDSDLIKTYVRAGMGWGLLAEMALTDGDADLAPIDLEGVFPSCTTWAVVQKNRATKEAMELVGELRPSRRGGRHRARVQPGVADQSELIEWKEITRLSGAKWNCSSTKPRV